MGKRLRLIVPVLSAALLAAISSGYADQLVKVVDHPIAGQRSLEDVRKRVIFAANKRGWTVEDNGPQQFKASIGTGNKQYEAVVSITYTDKAYSITLLESKGFGQKGDQINGRANRWIRNLEQDIQVQMESPALLP